MVTTYDLPSARIVDSAGVDLVLVGDSAANTVLGHDPISTVRATMDELVILTRAVSRGCEHAMLIGDLPFWPTRCPSRRPWERGRLVTEGGADVVNSRGRGVDRPLRGHRRGRHAGDGSHRPHAADGHEARRLQRPGQERTTRSGSSTMRSRSRRRAAAESCSSACPKRSPRDLEADQDSDHRHRRGRGTAMDRCSSSTTCSQARRRFVQAQVREALRPRRRRDAQGREGVCR